MDCLTISIWLSSMPCRRRLHRHRWIHLVLNYGVLERFSIGDSGSGDFSGDSGSGPGGSPRTLTDPGSGFGLSTSGSCIAVSPGRSSQTGGQVSRAWNDKKKNYVSSMIIFSYTPLMFFQPTSSISFLQYKRPLINPSTSNKQYLDLADRKTPTTSLLSKVIILNS